MVTRPAPGRLEHLKRSLRAYIDQTHERRDLVVVVDGDASAAATADAKAHIASLRRDDISVIEPPGGQTLGALRNIGAAHARGDVLCQWDDDDLCHPGRLERQLEALVGQAAEAVCLQEVMQFFPAERSLYCTNWRATADRAHPGTLMRWRRLPVAYPETGEAARRGEDSALVAQLQRRGLYGVLAGAPHLYVYVSHGENSWGDGHHRMLARSLGLSAGLLKRREAVLRDGLAGIDFGPGAVTVQGANAPAFTLGPAARPLSKSVLISCLMVALPVPRRLERLKQSLAAYVDQTHRRRELVLVVNGGEPAAAAAIKAHVAALRRTDIRIVAPAGILTLGTLRNLSRASARGEVVCQWDDDDLSHPERLERQLAALVETGAEGVCLQEVMQFFPGERRLYCTNWRATEAQAHPGTLMLWSRSPAVYPETGARSRLGEDLDMVLQLQRRGGYGVLAGAPHLHVYISHGGNSWDAAHHRMLATSLGLSQGLLRRRESALREGLAPFDFGPGAVTVQGANGPAFVLRNPSPLAGECACEAGG
ncbi:MAG TPA: glycosyltransferase family 2 protein [Caulobacteraceae bacterium]